MPHVHLTIVVAVERFEAIWVNPMAVRIQYLPRERPTCLNNYGGRIWSTTLTASVPPAPDPHHVLKGLLAVVESLPLDLLVPAPAVAPLVLGLMDVSRGYGGAPGRDSTPSIVARVASSATSSIL